MGTPFFPEKKNPVHRLEKWLVLIKEYGPYGPQGPWAHKTKMFLPGPGARGQGHDPKKAPGVRPGAGAFFGQGRKCNDK